MAYETEEPLEFLLDRVERQIELADIYGKWDAVFRVDLDDNRYEAKQAVLSALDLSRILEALRRCKDLVEDDLG